MVRSAPPATWRPVAPPLVQPPPPCMMIDVAGTGGPSPINFRNAPVRLYWYALPATSVVDVIVTLIDVGEPEQSVLGEHVTSTFWTLDATARSLTRAPFTH